MSAYPPHHRLDGPPEAPVLLLGGSLGTTLAMWKPQVQALADRLRLVRFDHRGHGGSPVRPGPYTIEQLGRDVLALLDLLELRRVCYCGLSIGGMVGMWLAANAPERIRRLVLICTAPSLPPAAAWFERAAVVRNAASAEAVADAVVERWFTPDYAAAHPDVVARHRAMIASTPAEGYAGCCEAIAALDLWPELERIAAPTLVIAGAQDPTVTPAMARQLAQAIPGARLEVLEPAAHLASVERAAEVSELIVGHVLEEGGGPPASNTQAPGGEGKGRR